MYNFLLSGTKGMNIAVWKKIDKATFNATQKKVTRPMHDWEVCLIEIDENHQDPYHALLTTIGARLIKKYTIHID